MESPEAGFLHAELAETQDRINALYAERAECANKAVKAQLLLELVNQMTGVTGAEEALAEPDPACYDYEDFFLRTRKPLPCHTFSASGKMVAFNNDFVIRFVDHIVVHEDVYEVHFKPSLVITVA